MEEIVVLQLIPRYDLRQQISELDVSGIIGIHVRTEGGKSFHGNP